MKNKMIKTSKFDYDSKADHIHHAFGINETQSQEFDEILTEVKGRFRDDPDAKTSSSFLQIALDVLAERKDEVPVMQFAYYMYGIGFIISSMRNMKKEYDPLIAILRAMTH